MSLARDIADLGAVTARLDTVGASSGALSNRNLVINGEMQVAQRGTSSTTNGYGSVDRFQTLYNGTDEAPTQAQVDVASGTTPYTLGFRKALKITNGNQTSGAGAADYLAIYNKIEGQDISSSGWNVTDPDSKLTLSYWVKSSVAQTFYGRFRAFASSQYEYTYSFALSANTWTKVTKTIIGNSNFSSLVNTNAVGFQHVWQCFFGTDYTNNKTLDAWAVKDNANKSPDMTSTWYTTNDATFEITGVQLEVGTATDFEHRSFGDEMSRCQRYFTRFGGTNTFDLVALGGMGTSSTVAQVGCVFPTRMRATPAVAMTDLALADSVNSQVTVNSVAISSSVANDQMAWMNFNTSGSITAHRPYYVRVNNNSTTGGLKFDAEL